MILGVCAWLSSLFNIDVKVVRIVFAVATVLGLGSPIIVYLILFVVKAVKQNSI